MVVRALLGVRKTASVTRGFLFARALLGLVGFPKSSVESGGCGDGFSLGVLRRRGRIMSFGAKRFRFLAQLLRLRRLMLPEARLRFRECRGWGGARGRRSGSVRR